jgi:hypothetical protein
VSTYATTDDVEALYEGTVPDRAQALLDRAERELARLVPDLATRIASATDVAGHIDQGLVRDTLVDAVIRVLRNPKGYAYEREGEYGYGYGVNNVAGTGAVTFTTEELARLRLPIEGTTWSGVGTITLVPGIRPPGYPRWLRADPSAWTGEEPAGVLPPMDAP